MIWVGWGGELVFLLWLFFHHFLLRHVFNELGRYLRLELPPIATKKSSAILAAPNFSI